MKSFGFVDKTLNSKIKEPNGFCYEINMLAALFCASWLFYAHLQGVLIQLCCLIIDESPYFKELIVYFRRQVLKC